MSKKIINSENKVVGYTDTISPSLEMYFQQYPNASLRKLAIATNSTYGIMLKKSKDPIPGVSYDPDAINWAAVESYLIKRGVDLREVDWDALNEPTSRKGTIVKDLTQFNVGDKVYLRREPTTPYTVLYKTETHIVIILEGSSEPLAWNNNTFLLNGPQFEPRAEKAEEADQ